MTNDVTFPNCHLKWYILVHRRERPPLTLSVRSRCSFKLADEDRARARHGLDSFSISKVSRDSSLVNCSRVLWWTERSSCKMFRRKSDPLNFTLNEKSTGIKRDSETHRYSATQMSDHFTLTQTTEAMFVAKMNIICCSHQFFRCGRTPKATRRSLTYQSIQ